MIFLIKEMFFYLRAKKNNGNGGYKGELAEINEKIGNHLLSVNGEISGIEREMTEMKMDIKNIQQSLLNIKISLTYLEK